MADEHVCIGCGKTIAEVVHNYSLKHFKKPLCRECQEISKNNPGPAASKPTEEVKHGSVDPAHIIRLGGKEFVTHAGLLDVAHKAGLVKIETEIAKIFTAEKITGDSTTATGVDSIIFKATVTMKGEGDTFKTFSAFGDADNLNTGERVREHKIRMAETRAINRALRFATNIGMCSVDELGEMKKE